MSVTKLESKSLDVLTNDLVMETEDINKLNLAKEIQRQAFLSAVERRPALLSRINHLNGSHFLKYAISKNYEWFIHLKKEQYFDEIAQAYIYNRLISPANLKRGASADSECMSFVVQKTFDEKTLLTCLYATPEGDELLYFDNQLGIPLSLKSAVKFTLKIADAVRMIEKIDLDVAYLGENKIKTLISEIVSCEYSAYLTEYITQQATGYYTLCTSFASIEKGVMNRLNSVLSDYGLAVTGVIIKRIVIPKDIQNKIEDQAFSIRQRKAEIEADAQLAQISLKNYEEKLAVQQKYPDTEQTLTEYEKDQALRRYLIKNGRDRQETVNRAISIKQRHESGDAQIQKPADIIPEITAKANLFRNSFIMALMFALLIFVIVLAAGGSGGAFIYLGIVTLIFGTVAAFNTERFKNVAVEPNTNPGKETQEGPANE